MLDELDNLLIDLGSGMDYFDDVELTHQCDEDRVCLIYINLKIIT